MLANNGAELIAIHVSQSAGTDNQVRFVRISPNAGQAAAGIQPTAHYPDIAVSRIPEGAAIQGNGRFAFAKKQNLREFFLFLHANPLCYWDVRLLLS